MFQPRLAPVLRLWQHIACSVAAAAAVRASGPAGPCVLRTRARGCAWSGLCSSDCVSAVSLTAAAEAASPRCPPTVHLSSSMLCSLAYRTAICNVSLTNLCGSFLHPCQVRFHRGHRGVRGPAAGPNRPRAQAHGAVLPHVLPARRVRARRAVSQRPQLAAAAAAAVACGAGGQQPGVVPRATVQRHPGGVVVRARPLRARASAFFAPVFACLLVLARVPRSDAPQPVADAAPMRVRPQSLLCPMLRRLD